MHNDLFDHLLITRFSYRGADGCSVEIDPLDRRRLARRFDVFEAVCLPAVLAQHERRFSWVLIIDAALPPVFRERLERLTDSHPFIHLHVYQRGTRIETLGWLSTYCRPGADNILTTALDDDDALCADYVEVLQDQVRALASASALPDIKLFGCTQALQWDYYPASQSPLGYVKPWCRRREHAGAFPLQSGFSALSRHSRLDVSVYAFRHSLGDLYLISDAAFAQLGTARQNKIQPQRDALKSAVVDAGLDWSRLCAQGAFVELLPQRNCVLMVNSMTNLQDGRLFEYRHQRRPVSGESSFPGFAIDLAAARHNIAGHGCSLSNLLAALLPLYKAALRAGPRRAPARSANRLKQALKGTWRCTRGILELRH